jgi:hypothetical protein
MKHPRLLLFVPYFLMTGTAALSQGVAQPGAQVEQSQKRDAEIHALQQELDSISKRLQALEAEDAAAKTATAPTEAAPVATLTTPTQATPAQTEARPPVKSAVQPVAAAEPNLLAGTTFGFALDGYYEYNFNNPIGNVNLLRAYDVTSNSFNINQADIVVEHLPTPQERAGGRIDLMFGQATETLGGSSVNEQRPQVWRNLFQAYGSYLAPVGSGLELDFGKWASSLGNEGNYTKDQITYTRGFLFNYLPFYHTGLRANYNVTPKVNVAYWLVNGANDTGDLNGFKSQAFLFTLKPASTVSWNVNYYFGEEGRGFASTLYPGVPTAPTQPGLPTANVSPSPDGREHIFDTYATWHATPKLTLLGEADYVMNRTYKEQKPARVALGAFEMQYTLTPNWYVGGRAEYFDDRDGLFSGQSQALKEFTVVANRTLAPGFQVRMEYRRDFTNYPFFLSSRTDVLEQVQPTATLGLIYDWGSKKGSW